VSPRTIGKRENDRILPAVRRASALIFMSHVKATFKENLGRQILVMRKETRENLEQCQFLQQPQNLKKSNHDLFAATPAGGKQSVRAPPVEKSSFACMLLKRKSSRSLSQHRFSRHVLLT
jgi:hypothetical protein